MSRQLLPALLNHRDVAAAIAPGNLAAFPPSLEVNAAYAGAVFCLPPASVQSFVVNKKDIRRLASKYREVALLALAATSFYAAADWKAPREALDQRLLQGEFRIHYTLTGENAFPFDVPPSQRAQQASVQLNTLTAQIGQANRYYSEQLGLTPPLSNERYRDVRSIDVHIIKLEEGKKGSTGDAAIVYRYRHFEEKSPVLSIALSNQWQPPNLTSNHEVFHAYQYALRFLKTPGIWKAWRAVWRRRLGKGRLRPSCCLVITAS